MLFRFNYWSIGKASGPAVIQATDTVAAAYYVSANQAVSTSTQINFDTREHDTTASVTTGASWKFTAPVSGKYNIAVIIASSSGSTIQLSIYKNGAVYKYLGLISSAGYVDGAADIALVAGDYIDVRPGGGFTAVGGTLSGSQACQINVKRVGN